MLVLSRGSGSNREQGILSGSTVAYFTVVDVVVAAAVGGAAGFDFTVNSIEQVWCLTAP